MTLTDLLPGQQARIVSVGGDGPLRRRLLDMGLTPGTALIMEQPAPSGDPLCIRVRSFELTLRRADASCIDIEGACAPSTACDYCPGCGLKPRRERRRRRGAR